MNNQPYITLNGDYCEMFNDNRTVKYIVRRSTSSFQRTTVDAYNVFCYVFDDGWQLGSNVSHLPYPSMESFFERVRECGAFSRALSELQELNKKDEHDASSHPSDLV